MRNEHLGGGGATFLPLDVLRRVRFFVRAFGACAQVREVAVGGAKVHVAECGAPYRVADVEQAADEVHDTIGADLQMIDQRHIRFVDFDVAYRVIALCAEEIQSHVRARAGGREYCDGCSAPRDAQVE